MHLGSRLSKEAANFAGEGDPVLVLERADSVDENLKDQDLFKQLTKLLVLECTGCVENNLKTETG